MPELPDVEALAGRIRRRLRHRRIRAVALLDPALATRPPLDTLAGRRIRDVSRRGKYLLFSLSDGRTLVVHLRMTGDLRIAGPGSPPERHTRLVLHLERGRELRFVDPRRLGVVYLVQGLDFQGIPGLRRMGPEPLSRDFTLRAFRQRLARRTGRIKALLLDQGFVAGIGNLYGDEILFQSRIRPSRRAPTLSPEEVRTLHRKIRDVLRKACEHGADLSRLRGWFLHGRARGRCVRCRGALLRVRIQGRYAHYCGRCQR